MVLMELIKTNEELVDVCKSISKEKFITIDTEFIREKTYWSKLCLIQICTHNKEIIIDPLENNIDLILSDGAVKPEQEPSEEAKTDGGGIKEEIKDACNCGKLIFHNS